MVTTDWIDMNDFYMKVAFFGMLKSFKGLSRKTGLHYPALEAEHELPDVAPSSRRTTGQRGHSNGRES